mgnify:CR=1 FL=1
MCEKLHNIKHGDAATKDRKKASTKEVDICDSKEEPSPVVGPLTVYFNHSSLVQGLKDLPNIAIAKFHKSLFDFLFVQYSTKRKGKRDSAGFRDHFGINQIQNATVDPMPQYYTDGGNYRHKLPHCCLRTFNNMNAELRSGMTNLLGYFDKKLNRDRCRDSKRSEIVRQIFRAAGWECYDMDWEYIDISIRSWTDTLEEHTDTKNCRRSGYDHAAVYSYLFKKNNNIFRVVIVMTFRTDLGSVMDRVHSLTAYKSQILMAIGSSSEEDSDKKSIKEFVTDQIKMADRSMRLLNKDNKLYDNVFKKAFESLEKDKLIEVNGTTKNKKPNCKRKRAYFTYRIVSRGKRNLR